MINSIIKS